MTRRLRPAHIVASGKLVWLVDARQPVAVALDPVGGDIVATVAWPFTVADDAAPWWQERAVVADGGGGIVVQGGFGHELHWLTVDGAVASRPADGVALSAAAAGVAWCCYGTFIELPDDPAPAGLITAITVDGDRRDIAVDRPVRNLAVSGDALVAVVALPLDDPLAILEQPETTVALTPDAVTSAVAVAELPPARRVPAGESFSWWHELDEEWIERHGLRFGGLRWVWGSPGDGDKINRQAVAIGFDDEAIEQVRCELGVGSVRGATVCGDELLLIVVPGRLLRTDAALPARIVAVDPTGRARRVAEATDLDITALCVPPERPSEVVIAEAEQALRDAFGDIMHTWADGSPLSERMVAGWVEIVGEWPDTEAQVNLRARDYGEVVLRRRLPLFDEFGQPIEYLTPAMDVMEDLDTGYLPPATDAVDGVLEF